jgi:uncharacterized membrane protein YidH (DUF202 family)
VSASRKQWSVGKEIRRQPNQYPKAAHTRTFITSSFCKVLLSSAGQHHLYRCYRRRRHHHPPPPPLIIVVVVVVVVVIIIIKVLEMPGITFT